MKKLILMAALACSAASAESLAEKITRALDASTAARTAFWGIYIVDPKSGDTLYEMNANRFFVPASNTKLFTTALALRRLGPQHSFTTTVRAEAAPDAQGIVRGEVRLVGGGDPNLSARPLPYRIGKIEGNPLAAIEDLAGQAVARGVRRIEGDIVGDDTWYVFAPYPEGWGIDDPQYEYGAPVSALTVNDNAFRLRLRPGAQERDPAMVDLNPPLEFYQIDNRVRTIASGERKVRFDRDPGGTQLRLWGAIPLKDKGYEMLLGIEDPAAYAAAALRAAFEARGVTITGSVGVRHVLPNEVDDLTQAAVVPTRPAWGVELARRESGPLAEDLQVVDKVSQNLHAELALRAVAKARRGIGSREAGVEEMKLFLDEAGVERSQYNLVDGSGLARLNLVTAATVMKLLLHMYRSPDRDMWIGLLPVGGEDGTLSSRFGNTPAKGRIRAKTGSLSHVAALSGYAERANGNLVAFSILVNNFNGPAAEVRGVMDRICNLIVE
jgi:D-alanyl-D-alanine carboxypeptidase/D-alanyl-D-alanine-endopeptidase (penicillin-binding protein 4)